MRSTKTITNHAVAGLLGQGSKNTLAFAAFCLPITAGAWPVTGLELWKEKRSGATRSSPWWSSLLGAASSGRFYPHYFIAAVPPCAAGGTWFAESGEPVGVNGASV
jgi:hypothetical protein